MAEAAKFDLSTAFLDQPKTIAYGLVRGAGNLVLQQELADKTRIAFYMLGEGPWDSLLRLWINAKLIALPSAATVHFHPGVDGEIGNGMASVSTGGDQHVDQFFSLLPAGLDPITFSRFAWLAVKVAPDPGAPSAQLTVLADYQAMQVRQFDSSGNQTAFAWTQNWAWIVCDYLIRKFILREGRTNQPLTAAELARFDWPSFVAATAYYDAIIGGGVKRFSDGGVVFVNDSNTADRALEQLLLMCRSYILERNGKMGLYPDQPRASIFVFSSDNTQAKSFKTLKSNLRGATNRLTPTFRDYNLAAGSADDATRFAITPNPTLDHEAHQRSVGVRGPGLAVIPKVTPLALDLGINSPERAWRILKSMLVRHLGDDVDANSVYNAPWTATWTGYEDSVRVVPGSVVRIDRSVGEEAGSAPPRSNATRIQTAGGTAVGKYYIDGVAPSVNGQAYELQVSVTNNGPNTLRILSHLGAIQDVFAGETRFVLLNSIGDGVSNLQIVFNTLNVGDALDFIARDPVLRRAGVDENLIVSANRDFTGWNAFSGAVVTLTQGQKLGVEPFLCEVLEVLEKADGTREFSGLEYMPNAFPDAAPPQQTLQAPAPGTGLNPAASAVDGTGNLLVPLDTGVQDGTMFLRSPQFSHPENVENGNFDLGSGSVVPGWAANFASISIDSTTTPTTGNSLKLNASSIFGSAISIRRFRVTPGEVYKVSGYVKSDGTGQPDIQLMFFDASGTYLGGVQYIPGTPIIWTFGSATGTVPANATQAKLSLQNQTAGGAGVCWFKGIAVVKARILDDEVLDGTAFARHVASDMTGNRIDFSKGLLNKHLGNMPDDATSDRRAATANEKTGGANSYTLTVTGSSTPLNMQASAIPVSIPSGLINFIWSDGGSFGPTGNPGLVMTWAAFNVIRPDGSSIAVPASSALATPPAPTLGQTPGGTLATHTLFVRLAYIRASAILAIGPEASFAVAVNNRLTITSPPANAAYDGWIPLISFGFSLVEGLTSDIAGGGTTPISPIAFGTNYSEPVTGVSPLIFGQRCDIFISTAAGTLGGLVVLGSTASSTTYSLYPTYDQKTANLVFPDGIRAAAGDATTAGKAISDKRILLGTQRLQTTSPAAGGTGSGSGGGGRFMT